VQGDWLRLHVLLRRDGHVVNHQRVFRVYREERLMSLARRTQKGLGHTRTDAGSGVSERPLITEFCLRSLRVELTSNAILSWASWTDVGWPYIAPGKPMQSVRMTIRYRPRRPDHRKLRERLRALARERRRFGYRRLRREFQWLPAR